MAVYQTTKGPAEKYIVGEESDTTFHRMSLLALLEGLKMLKKPCKVTAYTPDQFLASTVNEGALEKWKREEWRRPQDKELKNKELWKRLAEEKAKHEVYLVYTRSGVYSETLKKSMEEKKNV